MDIEGISGAATVALASTLVFVLIARSWQLIHRALGGAGNFPGSIMREAAQRFRDEFDRLGSSQSTYLSASVMFAVLFVAAYALQAGQLFAGYPVWQLHILLATLAAAALLAVLKMLRMVQARRRLRLRRDANIAIGHQLHRLAAGVGRTYHDVDTPAGTLDHLAIGPSGAYAVSVFACPVNRNSKVSLHAHELSFGSGSKTCSLVATNAKIASLEREFRRLLDHRVRIRSVIAIPGWDIEAQNSDEHLMVNEKNLAMLSGWKDRSDFLLDEDVEALHGLLTERCTRRAWL